MQNFYKFIRWDITGKCNLNCLHCRSANLFKKEKNPKFPDLDTKQVMNAINELFKGGVRNIHLLGGEPFKRRDIEKIIKYASSLGIAVSVNTNGTLLNSEKILNLIKLDISGITFSIDGAKEDTNNKIRGEGIFNNVIKNIKSFVEYKEKYKKDIHVVVSMVLMRPNLCETDEMITLCSKLGVNALSISYPDCVGNMEINRELLLPDFEETFEAIGKIIKKIPEHPELDISMPFITPKVIEYYNRKYDFNIPFVYVGCKAITLEAYMQPDGAIFPCFFLTDKSDLVKNQILEINRLKITNLSFENIFNSKQFTHLHRILQDKTYYDMYIPCNRCKYVRRICNPCPLHYLESGKKEQKLCLIAEKKLAAL